MVSTLESFKTQRVKTVNSGLQAILYTSSFINQVQITLKQKWENWIVVNTHGDHKGSFKEVRIYLTFPKQG